MINAIIDFSINNKKLIGIMTVLLAITGIWCMTQVPVDAVPDITNNQVQIITQAPKYSTEDIEQYITYPVEVQMANLPGLIESRSVSRFGLSVVTLVFEDEMQTYLPRQLVGEQLNKLKEKIPAEIGTPEMGPISTGLGEIYQYTLQVEPKYKDQFSLEDLRTFQNYTISRQLGGIPGVIEINSFGGVNKQYEISIDPYTLDAMNLSIQDVFQAVNKNNQNTGGAYIEKNKMALFIRGKGRIENLEDIKNTVVSNQNGSPVKIKDIANVGFGQAVRYGAVTKDGKGEVVGGMIMMLKGANSKSVIQQVEARIQKINTTLPKGVKIEPFISRTNLIENTTNTVTTNLIEGGLIVIFVLVLLLGNWRGGVIVASTIPLSLLFAFIGMYYFDVWANLMSLGAIDFGIMIDGAVIIVERTVFILSSKQGLGTSKNTSVIKEKAAANASKQMMNTAFFGQLIILMVFIPILGLEGVEGKMFQPMAFTFAFAMLGAMVLCLTYVPMMSSVFITLPKRGTNNWISKGIQMLSSAYEKQLAWVLQKGGIVLTIAFLALVGAAYQFQNLGGEFLPELDEGDIAFHSILAPGSTLTEAIETNTKLEKIILDNFPEVKTVISRMGVADVPTDPMPMEMADIFVILKDKKEWVSANNKEALIQAIKDKISVVPGVNFEFTQPIEMRFNELLTGVREDIAIKLYGEDLEILASKASEIAKNIQSIPGVADMKIEATKGLRQISIEYNREQLALYGLDIQTVSKTLSAGFTGTQAGVLYEQEKRFPIVVRLKEPYRNSIEQVRQMRIALPNGGNTTLETVAHIAYKEGPMQISRDNGHRRVYVGINVRGRDVASLVEEIQLVLADKLTLPTGYYLEYGGAFENLTRAKERLTLLVPITLMLIFLLIYFALKSFKQTLMIYAAIPLSVIGGVFALWFRDMPFSISAGVGFIVLFGVAVLNGLVLVSSLNDLKGSSTLSLKQRILQGTKQRIRPILLTALTDILGFLPMAISVSAGAEVQRPLATVVIGGLLSATLLTLFVLPILYQWVEQKQIIKRKESTSNETL